MTHLVVDESVPGSAVRSIALLTWHASPPRTALLRPAALRLARCAADQLVMDTHARVIVRTTLTLTLTLTLIVLFRLC